MSYTLNITVCKINYKCITYTHKWMNWQVYTTTTSTGTRQAGLHNKLQIQSILLPQLTRIQENQTNKSRNCLSQMILVLWRESNIMYSVLRYYNWFGNAQRQSFYPGEYPHRVSANSFLGNILLHDPWLIISPVTASIYLTRFCHTILQSGLSHFMIIT